MAQQPTFTTNPNQPLLPPPEFPSREAILAVLQQFGTFLKAFIAPYELGGREQIPEVIPPAIQQQLDVAGTTQPLALPLAVGSRGVAMLPRIMQTDPTHAVYKLRNALGQLPFRGQAEVTQLPTGRANIGGIVVRRGEAPITSDEFLPLLQAERPNQGVSMDELENIFRALGEELTRAGVAPEKIGGMPTTPSRARLYRRMRTRIGVPSEPALPAELPSLDALIGP